MKCNKCNKEFKMLAKGTCALCDPKGWAIHFNKLTGKGVKK